MFDLNLGGLLWAVTDSEFTQVSGLFCLENAVSLESPTITSSFGLLFPNRSLSLNGKECNKERSKVSLALYTVGDLFVNYRLLQEEASDKG